MIGGIAMTITNKRSILLSEVNENNNDILEDVIIDDATLMEAIVNYQKGKVLESEAKKLIDQSKKIFDAKLYSRNVKSATNHTVKISYTEYKSKRFDTERFKKENPSIYDMFATELTIKRYNIEPIVEINSTINIKQTNLND